MYGINSVQNQVFLPLSHVASVVGSFRGAPFSSPRPVKNCNKIRKKVNLTSDECDITCFNDSFEKAFENSTELQLSLLVLKNKEDLVKQLCPFLMNQHSTWRVSHVSAESFFENKHGFSKQNLSDPYSACTIVLPSKQSLPYVSGMLLKVQHHPLLERHQRSFRTRHGDSSTGLGGRLRTDAHKGLMNRIYNLRFIRDEKDKAKLRNDAEKSDRLKAILGEETLGVEEQQRIKVAFAEGYLSADSKGRSGSKLKIFNIFRDLLGIVLIIAMLFTFMGGSFRVQIGNTNEVHPEEINVTFGDVKGVDEAKQELLEIVEFLKNPEKFSSLGGKLPKGVLLVGPPGTGKTLLARAVAGEAGVPFFHAAGPEFDEILVGQGARRVRDLFNTAKLRAPCVIFIDEIDSVGAKRTNSVLHPYANQTINQLLSEMDGFRQNEGVIVLGATNRREDLDRALLRPGRFDVEVQVPPPDLQGRKEILQFYLSKIKTGTDVDIDVLARGTTGFTGADIENLVNQAAVRAAIDEAAVVTMKYLENSRDKVLMGPERKSRIPDEEANLITAYHEGGHALVAFYTKDSHPLHKVTIIPRGPSLGHTAYIPEKEWYHVTKSQMMATIDTLMGGRAAEEIIFGPEKITTGASSDFKQATNLATRMVKEWGMSEKVGVRTFDDEHNSLVIVNDLGQSTTETIDAEIKRLLHDSYERAKNILRLHAKEHKSLAEALVKYETLDAEDIKAILGGRERKEELKRSPRPPASSNDLILL
uniref:ATP-dependent zinc metalloprotease YME1 n=1 Tax=Hemiscolopendra marginata TaxID=943146 RepID=A0A646QDM3_9MYRI